MSLPNINPNVAVSLEKWHAMVASKDLAGARPQDVIRWAAEAFRGRVLISQSMANTALAHLVHTVAPEIPAVFLDTGDRLFLIDCGAGLDYAGAVAALGHRALAGLVLTHAHADHWLALPEALAQLAPDGWVARPGLTLAPAVLRAQALFEFFDRPIDTERLMAAWEALPPRALADVPDQPLWDVNAGASAAAIELAEADWERVHCACITPAIRCAGQVGVFGADLDGGQWARIADALPRSIALLQAPNHGGPPGRMARALLDDHLRPGVVVVTDAQPIVDDHLDWYAAGGRAAYTLQDRRTITVTMTAAGVEVDVGGLALPMA